MIQFWNSGQAEVDSAFYPDSIKAALSDIAYTGKTQCTCIVPETVDIRTVHDAHLPEVPAQSILSGDGAAAWEMVDTLPW